MAITFIGFNMNFDSVTKHIPWVMQSLYNPSILQLTTLEEIRDAFRTDQIKGKSWLLNQLKDCDRNLSLLVIGSWFGFTSYCLFQMGFNNITETDLDSRLELMSRNINKDIPNFKHLNNDVNDLDLSSYDLIINTSCEHINDNRWFDNIRPGTLVVLQSTNLKAHDHTNTVENLEEMKSKYSLNLQYSDKLELNKTYSRFMLIGSKP